MSQNGGQKRSLPPTSHIVTFFAWHDRCLDVLLNACRDSTGLLFGLAVMAWSLQRDLMCRGSAEWSEEHMRKPWWHRFVMSGRS
eukprot:454153-Amphidinium_carterae.3